MNDLLENTKYNGMNNDTIREVNKILSKGYYFKHTTLGNGGWPYLHEKVKDWKNYRIYFYVIDDYREIIAKDDDTAINAFNELYNLEACDYIIDEIITTIRTIKENITEIKD